MNTRLTVGGKCNALSGNTGGDNASGHSRPSDIRQRALSSHSPMGGGGGLANSRLIAFVLIHWPTGVSVFEKVCARAN
jgi:hypothetical protein